MMIESKRDSKWWIGAIVAPLLLPGLGLLYAAGSERSESDWMAGWLFRPLILTLLLGTLSSCGFTIISFLRRESGAVYSLLGGLPSLLLLVSSFYALEQSSTEPQRFRNQQKSSTAEIDSNKSVLAGDPLLALREHWDQPEATLRWSAFASTFTDKRHHYTEDQMKQIYQDAPTMRGVMFMSPDCTQDFLVSHFEQAEASFKADPKNPPYYLMSNILHNANTPIDLIQRVSQSKVIPSMVISDANEVLKSRSDPSAK